MKQKLFKSIFLSSMAVVLATILLLALILIQNGASDMLLQCFTPILAVVALAVVLSTVLATKVSKSVTKPLDQIDFARPDERDVDVEFKPLIRRLADQNRQIRTQMEALAQEHESRDRMRREFTANVSHELKTPLTSISGFAELMRDGLVRSEDVPRFAGKITDEAHRLITLVEDIIKLSRLDDKSMAPAMEPLQLRRETEEILCQLEPVARRQNIELTLEGGTGEILGARQMVGEMLYNLCDNAIKYNHPNGSVLVTISDTREGVSITVSDTGIGIPQEDLPRIFERFYRVDKSHSKEVGGTGLGLSIVKHGAIYHNAKIQVDSALGRGTKITLVFPPYRPIDIPAKEARL